MVKNNKNPVKRTKPKAQLIPNEEYSETKKRLMDIQKAISNLKALIKETF